MIPVILKHIHRKQTNKKMCFRLDFSFESKKSKDGTKALLHVQIDSVTVVPQGS